STPRYKFFLNYRQSRYIPGRSAAAGRSSPRGWQMIDNIMITSLITVMTASSVAAMMASSIAVMMASSIAVMMASLNADFRLVFPDDLYPFASYE
ncbi:hypothetical protein, partial [Methanothrix sp.]|uniref:hypothetical protein n=1 Tax=Methanothrix sp. TaxID=90426 RepID=UPI003C7952A1